MASIGQHQRQRESLSFERIKSNMRRTAPILLCLLAVTFTRSSTPLAASDSKGRDEQTGPSIVLLAIDEQSLPLLDNVALSLSKPMVRSEAVLTPERDDPNAPDQLAAHFYGTVLHDQGKFRMWYYGAHRAGGRWKVKGQPCYAESDDGIHWTKPKLGQVEINRSKENNGIALVRQDTQGVTLIKDESDADPARRYKMVFQYMPKDYPTLKTAVSPDGIRWTTGGDLPAHEFREQASFFKHDGRYIVCGHTPSTDAAGNARGRQGFAWVSSDFDRWPVEQAESFFLPEPPPSPGYRWAQRFDQVHLGVGGASLGRVAVGLYGRWRERGWGEGGTSCDLCLVVSNDGIHFREPIPGAQFIGADEVSLPAVPGKHFPNLLTQGNGILNVGDETRIYFGRWRNSEWPLAGDGSNYYAEIGLATLPRDRWGALTLPPKTTAGSLWSAPIKFPKNVDRICLNAEGADGIRVEIGDENFELLPQFSGEKAGVCKQPVGLQCDVRWPIAGINDLAGKTVRLRVHLAKKTKDPKLFAIYVTNHSQSD
jgi:hypothetical protein